MSIPIALCNFILPRSNQQYSLKTIAALKEGDRVIFEAVFHQYHERIYLYIFHKTQSTYLAEETTQLTFIKLWQYRENLSEDYQLFTQLFRIARTTLIDLLRKEEYRKGLEGKGGMPAPADEVLDSMAAREMQKKMWEMVAQMPPVRKQVFTMSRMQHMTPVEIAQELSISVKTVEGHITRALKDLRGILLLCLICRIF